MLKKILCLMLSFVAIISLCSMPKAEAANESVKTQLMKLYNRFPHGKYWNHVGVKDWDSDTVTSTPCSGHGKEPAPATVSIMRFSVWAMLIKFPMKLQVFHQENIQKAISWTFQS